jgi:hypothetical protein
MKRCTAEDKKDEKKKKIMVKCISLPAKLFTAFSPTTMSRLQAICQTPTLTEPEMSHTTISVQLSISLQKG